MNTKRKHITLSLDKKLQVLTHISNKIPYSSIAKKYSIGKSTVCDIQKHANDIKAFAETGRMNLKKRKTLKPAKNPQLEEAVYLWFLQKRSLRFPITNEILLQKAHWFQSQLNSENFQNVSSGWLRRFKVRYDIRQLKISGEKLSNNMEAVNPFKSKFREVIIDMRLMDSQIYNADESALFWKSFEINTLVSNVEKSAPGRKKLKNRITFMSCSNMDGSNKLRIMVLGKSKNPRAFKNSILPVYYNSSTKGWMNKFLFKEWFQNEFIPSVITFSKTNNIPPTALLILDNAPSHYNGNELESDDGLIKVMYLPPNTTALIQPMDQNVIQNIKIQYRKRLINEVLAADDVSVRIKNFSLKEAVFMLYHSWQAVTTSVIRSSWNKIYNDSEENENNSWEDDDLISLRDLANKLNVQMHTGELITTNEVIQSLNNPHEQVEYDIYNDTEIVEIASRGFNYESIDNNSTNDSEHEDELNCSESFSSAPLNSNISTRSALNHIDNLIIFAEDKNYELGKILLLRNMRNDILNELNNNI